MPRLNYALGKCYSRENSIKRSRVPLLRYHFSSEESDFVSSNFINSIVKIRLPVPPLISRDPPDPGRESARFRAKEKIFFLEKRMERNESIPWLNVDDPFGRIRTRETYSSSRRSVERRRGRKKSLDPLDDSSEHWISSRIEGHFRLMRFAR